MRPEKIVEIVAADFGVTEQQIIDCHRGSPIVTDARAVVMFLLWGDGWRERDIAVFLKKKPTCVKEGKQKVRNLCVVYPEFRSQVMRLWDQIKPVAVVDTDTMRVGRIRLSLADRR